jgi:hypothetical protein
MDFFGIGQAMKAMVQVYRQASRATGRTISLVESVKNGDRICFSNPEECGRVKRLCKDRGINIDCIVISPSQPELIFNRPPSQGRTIFDHGWIEDYYSIALERCEKAIDTLERENSGFGEAHRETQKKAMEMSKWHL